PALNLRHHAIRCWYPARGKIHAGAAASPLEPDSDSDSDPDSDAAGAPSERVCNRAWRLLAGALASVTTRRTGASARFTTRAIRASRLGSLVMSSTCAGPITTPSTAPPLIWGFLRTLTWREI